MFHRNATKIGLLAVLAGSTLVMNGAYAATVSATASILSINSTLLSLSNNQYLNDASTPFQSGFDVGNVLQSYTFSNTASNGDTSFAGIDNSFAPTPQTSAGAANNGSGSSTVLWTFDWAATTAGMATLDLEYLFSATVANYSAGEKAIASSFISVGLDGTQNQQESLFYFNNQNGNTSGISNMLLNFNVNAGESGTFTVSTASNAAAMSALTPVPVPAAVWLFGSAIAGLIGFSRRKV